MSDVRERLDALIEKKLAPLRQEAEAKVGSPEERAGEFFTDSDMNSLAILALFKAINKEFNVDIRIQDIEKMADMDDVVAYLEEHAK